MQTVKEEFSEGEDFLQSENDPTEVITRVQEIKLLRRAVALLWRTVFGFWKEGKRHLGLIESIEAMHKQNRIVGRVIMVVGGVFLLELIGVPTKNVWEFFMEIVKHL